MGPVALLRKMEEATRSSMFQDGCRLLSSNSQDPTGDTVEVEEERDGSQDFETNLQSQVPLVPDREKMRVKKNLFGAGLQNPKVSMAVRQVKQKLSGQSRSGRNQAKLPPTPAVQVKHSQLVTWVTSQQVRVKRRTELPRLASGSSGRVAKWERFQDEDKERKYVRGKYRSKTSSQPMLDFQLNLPSPKHSPAQAGDLAGQQEEVDEFWKNNSLVEVSDERKDNTFFGDTEVISWNEEVGSFSTQGGLGEGEWKQRGFGLNLGVGRFLEESSTLPYQSRNEVDFQHHLSYNSQSFQLKQDIGGREHLQLAGRGWSWEVPLPDIVGVEKWGEESMTSQPLPAWEGGVYQCREQEEGWTPRPMW